MTTLEQRITETLDAHQEVAWSPEGGAHCGGCDLQICASSDPIDEQHERLLAHQAAAILPLIREAQAEAFDRAADCAPEYMPRNPYRSNDE